MQKNITKGRVNSRMICKLKANLYLAKKIKSDAILSMLARARKRPPEGTKEKIFAHPYKKNVKQIKEYN
jgi:hypothetical protein